MRTLIPVLAMFSPTRFTPKQLEERRLRAGNMLSQGKTQAEIARALGISTAAANQWAKRYEEGGMKALRCTPHTGRPPKLTKQQRENIPDLLAQGAEAHGFENDIWTTERVATLIKNEFDIDYHPGHVWKLLQSLGMSWKRPQRHALNRDDEAINRWIREEWPRLKNAQRSSEQ